MGLSENGEVFKFVANRTFPNFIDLVLSKSNNVYGTNEHWMPFYMYCNFCRIDYDMIGRMEHFEEYINKLRTSGLRPTIQRIMISRILILKTNK